MKVMLDDRKAAPKGWKLATTGEEFLEVCGDGRFVDAVSLDHDLGDGMNGYAVVLEMLQSWKFWPEIVYVHTMNPAGRDDMVAALQSAPEKVRVIVR